MTDYIIDTNVWVNVDKNITQLGATEIDCVQECGRWLREFVFGEGKLLLDGTYGAAHGIQGEYQRKIVQGSLARRWFNSFLQEQNYLVRVADVAIAWDNDGFAILPDDLLINHRKDRKFVAVAIEYRKDHPTPPIVYSTETDWRKEKEKLEKGGIVLLELCPAFIDEHYKG